MKKLRITIEGRSYDVTVQVLEDDEATVSGANALSPLPYVSPAPSPSRSAASSPTVTPNLASLKVDENLIRSPIAGTVQKVFVEVGARVEAKAPVILLDAMKMDTYIYAPREGEIEAVEVKVTESVAVGATLIRYKPRG